MDDRVGRVLAEIWQGTEGYVFLPAKTARGWSESAAFRWPQHQKAIFVRPEGGVDNYFCPLVFSEPRRQSEYALPTHVLWADLDEADPRKCRLLPSVAWKTTQGGSDGAAEYNVLDASQGLSAWKVDHWQALWLLGETAEDAHGHAGTAHYHHNLSVCPNRDDYNNLTRTQVPPGVAAGLSKRIAYAEPGADRSGWDVTQVLRLPGTLNHKHNPPQRIELLWAKKLYYTMEQVRAAYPPVPKPQPSEDNGWPSFTPEEVTAAYKALPMGLQMAMERDESGADRSLELLRMARVMVKDFKVDPAMAAVLLERSSLGRSKYGGRRDAHHRLLTTVADAMLD